MAISIDWPAKVIAVPKADTALVDLGPPEIRSLDVDQFRKDLNALQASVEGMPEDTTHTHNPPVTVGGVILGRVVELINGYTITFENASYAVNLTNANNNISDVTNLNLVSIRSANSAGLQIVETGVSGLTASESAALLQNTTDLSAIAAYIAAFQIRPPRGVALDKFPFYMVESSDSKTPATGKTPTVEVAVPGVGWAATTNATVEQGLGWYYVDLTAAEMNGEFILARATATGADVANLAMMTAPVV